MASGSMASTGGDGNKTSHKNWCSKNISTSKLPRSLIKSYFFIETSFFPFFSCMSVVLTLKSHQTTRLLYLTNEKNEKNEKKRVINFFISLKVACFTPFILLLIIIVISVVMTRCHL